jgi:23S rRNA (uracil1939-C5)-methyltransferase
MNQPIRVGEKVVLKIEALANSPDGIGKINNFVVFVPYVVPEDEVKVLITEVRKNFARGKLLSLIKPSEYRVKPICASFGECGGCHWQHIDYKKQLEYKDLLIKNAFSKIEAKIKPIIPAKKIFYYRNKSQFPVDNFNKKIGLYALKSHYVVDLKECNLVLNSINDVYREIKKYLEKVNYNILNLRHVVIRGSETQGSLLVVFVLKDENLEKVESLIKYIKQKFSFGSAKDCRYNENGNSFISILCNINDKDTNVILGDKTIKIYGDGILKEVLDGIEYNFSSLSFFQTNTEQTLILYRLIKSYINDNKDSIALDLYCGVGTVALFIADKFKEIIGVDEERSAISDARDNAKINNIKNCKFLYGKVEDILVKLIRDNMSVDTVILDPPRKGCNKDVLLNLRKLNVSNLIYVSCDIATLARDIYILIEEGFRVEEIQPIDMFPNTYHIETVVKMGKQGVKKIEKEKAKRK